jgi:hypothetical protein
MSKMYEVIKLLGILGLYLWICGRKIITGLEMHEVIKLLGILGLYLWICGAWYGVW